MSSIFLWCFLFFPFMLLVCAFTPESFELFGFLTEFHPLAGLAFPDL